jgi:hypothetical protein
VPQIGGRPYAIASWLLCRAFDCFVFFAIRDLVAQFTREDTMTRFMALANACRVD